MQKSKHIVNATALAQETDRDMISIDVTGGRQGKAVRFRFTHLHPQAIRLEQLSDLGNIYSSS